VKAYERFAVERVAPLMQEVGVVEPPEFTVFDVHNHLFDSRWKR